MPLLFCVFSRRCFLSIGADRLVRERAVIVLTEPRVEAVCNLPDGNARPVTSHKGFRHDLKDLRWKRLPLSLTRSSCRRRSVSLSTFASPDRQ